MPECRYAGGQDFQWPLDPLRDSADRTEPVGPLSRRDVFVCGEHTYGFGERWFAQANIATDLVHWDAISVDFSALGGHGWTIDPHWESVNIILAICITVKIPKDVYSKLK